jgi:hypothetical protein
MYPQITGLVTLGGIDLPDDIIWTDEFDFQPVAQSVTRTIAGNHVEFNQALVLGRPITLEASETQGWLTKTQVDALQTLAATPGATYTLDIGAQTFTVAFRHDEDAFDPQPFLQRIDPDAGDFFSAIIRLRTV